MINHTQTEDSSTDLARKLRNGELTCVSLTARTLDRIERENPQLNAFTFIAREAAIRQAEVLDIELASGKDRGPLHGIPVAVKDNIDTADMPTTYGSRFFSTHTPAVDARCVDNLRQAGAVIIGKTVTSEFALGPTGEFSAQGAARNPHDTDRMTGGSSAGSACAVAAGLVTCAVGSDTGGSIRIPSAFCGVVGLKPSYASVSLEGVFPVSGTLDHVGPIARNETDAAVLLAALQGAEVPASTEVAAVVRAGWCDPSGLIEVDAEVLETVRSYALSRFGDGLRSAPLEKGCLVQIRQCVQTILLAEAHCLHEDRLREQRDVFCPPVAERVLKGAEISSARYINALSTRATAQAAIAELFKDFDVLVMPTTAVTAPMIGSTQVEINGVQHAVNDAASALTAPWNLLGYPVLSMPAGVVNGMPVGIQIISRPGSDFWLLQLAGRL